MEVAADRPGDVGDDTPETHGHPQVDATVDEEVVGVDGIAYLEVEAKTVRESKHPAGDEDTPLVFHEEEVAYLVVVVAAAVVDEDDEEEPGMEGEAGWGDGSPFLAREADGDSSERIC